MTENLVEIQSLKKYFQIKKDVTVNQWMISCFSFEKERRLVSLVEWKWQVHFRENTRWSSWSI